MYFIFSVELGIICVALCAIVFLCYYYGNNYGNHYPSNASENHKITENIIATRQRDAHEHNHREDEKKFWKKSIVTNIATICVAVFAVILAAFSFEDAHESLVAVQRAFVFANPVTLLQPINKNDNSPTDQWRYGPEWENSGNTQTVDLQVRLACPNDYFNTLDVLNDPATNLSERSGRVLGPKQKTIGGFCTFSKDDILNIRNHGKHYWVIAISEYKEIFGSPHITEVCSEFIEVAGNIDNVPGLALQISTAVCPTHNCADNQCGQDQLGDHRTKPNWIKRMMITLGFG